MSVTMTFYNKFVKNVGLKKIDLLNDTLKVILVSDSYTFSAAHEDLADVSGELATGNGYTAGGATLANVTWDNVDEVTTLDADNVTWSATGGSIGPAIGAIIYDDTSTDNLLVAYIDFDAEESAGDGTDFKITFNASGVFSVTA